MSAQSRRQLVKYGTAMCILQYYFIEDDQYLHTIENLVKHHYRSHGKLCNMRTEYYKYAQLVFVVSAETLCWLYVVSTPDMAYLLR